MTSKQLNQLKESAKNYRGVHFDASKGKFRARVTIMGNNYSLGYYSNPVEAALAVNKKAKSVFRTKASAVKNGYWNEVATA